MTEEKKYYTYEIPMPEGRHIGGGRLPDYEETRKYEKLPPVDFEILSYRMYSVVNEGRSAIMRVSGSPVVAEGGEALFALYDPYGVTSSLACGLLLHMVGTQGFVKETLEVQSEWPGIYDGDMFMYNEPSIGGIHACDQWTGTPIFYKDELIGWLGGLTHTAETGAVEPGGMPPSARSLLHEGYRVQGIKVQERGRINRAALNCVLRSSRDPAYYVLDLRARIAGLNVAKDRFLRLIDRYGLDKVKAVIQQNIDYSEALARAKLRSLADGTWRAVTWGDWDMGPEPKLWKIFLTATKEGDSLTLDFTGTSPPNEGPANCMIHGAMGTVFVGIASQLFWEIPGNYGILKPLKVFFPEGTLVNVPFLHPCGFCPPNPGINVSDTVTTIIAKMFYTNKKYWGDINAPWHAGKITAQFWGGVTQQGYRAGMFGDQWAGGTGAGIDEGRKDGCDTGAKQMTIESCIADVESNELLYPFLYLWRREEINNAAPGRFRSGASVSWAVTPHNTPFATIAYLGRAGKYADQGQSLDGAYPPSLGEVIPAIARTDGNLLGAFKEGWKPDNTEDLQKLIRERGGQFIEMEPGFPLAASQPVKADSDVIISAMAGGRGIGDPLDREPERVLEDVRGKIYTLEMARKVFGVVIDIKTWTVDIKATEMEREKIRARRRERGKIWKGK